MEDSSSLGHVDQVKEDVQETVAMLDAVMQTAQDGSVRAKWEEEKKELMETSSAYGGLFDRCTQKM
jgi:tRNA nucleotidyltransferase (CCA-adding enzyme)